MEESKHARAVAKKTDRCEAVKAVIHRMNENQMWDSVQARDLDPVLIDFVTKCLDEGMLPGDIAKRLGLRGGLASKPWKKIQAYFRQGFRADAEAYLYQQTHKFYKVLEKAREVLEDAIENGTPETVVHEGGHVEVIRVKGATKELGSFLESYTRSIAMPVRLWKDFGAIGENKNLVANAGLTIVVKTNVPMPTQAEVDAHREEMNSLLKPVIDVTAESQGLVVAEPKE